MSPRSAEASSTTTATATLGSRSSSAWAQETNHAYGTPELPMPCWAVPVLPPTVAPGIAALAPVPARTTSVISSRMSAAVDGRITWRAGRGPKAETVAPPESVVRSTRYGGRACPPLATAAATLAICSGVARVLYCPIEDSASCARSTLVSKVLWATEKGMRRPRSLKPKAWAVDTMSAAPTSTPSLANSVLHDHSKATRTETSLQPSDSFVSRVLVPGSRYGSGETVEASRSVTTPASSAAAAVTTLKVAPGGYVCRPARLSIGFSGSSFSRAQADSTASPFPDSSAGSYDGVDTSARIRPVAGSIAATAPLRVPSPSNAAS